MLYTPVRPTSTSFIPSTAAALQFSVLITLVALAFFRALSAAWLAPGRCAALSRPRSSATQPRQRLIRWPTSQRWLSRIALGVILSSLPLSLIHISALAPNRRASREPKNR